MAADAINGYVLSRYTGGVYELERLTEGLLHGGARRVIVGARCEDEFGGEEIALSP
jgi:hypothetical protein